MQSTRKEIGGLGNILFKEAYIWGQFRDGKIPDIYVQSSTYWEKYKEEMRVRFSAGIRSIDRVALHIRRGDYLRATEFHTNLWDTDYYREAVKLFPGEKFLVFCKDNQGEAQDKNDQEWCTQNLPSLGIDFEMYEHGQEEDDLNTMASCKGIIGANSSFAWWGAFLGDPGKKIVMPREDRWFVDGKVRAELPKEWTKI